MKKILNKINLAIIAIMVSMPAFALTGEGAGETTSLCKLITRLHDVFTTLRTLAFVGAAFYIAGWAWTYISSGEAKMDDVKKKGIGLLVGFFLLFMIGVILTAVSSTAGQEALGCKVLETW